MAGKKKTAEKEAEKKTDAPKKAISSVNSLDRIGKILSRDVFKKLSKEHGNLILTRASDARVAKMFRIPSGIFSLDVKLGGGWPQGRVVTLFGMKSTGKTTALLRTLANIQRMCSNCWTFVQWTHQVEVDEEAIDEKTGEVTKVKDAKGHAKKVKAWKPLYVKRWWADSSGKWRVMLKGDLKETIAQEEDDKGKKKDIVKMVPDVVLGEEIRPECDCHKYREAVCAFIDVEGTFDKQWAMRIGVDLLKLMLSQPEYAEQSLDIADALVRSGEIDALVLDSVAFLTPSKEIAESTAKFTVGEQARLVNKGVRKFVSGLNAVALHSERRPTIFLTNQIRMKIGVVFGNPETTSGGLAPGFASSTELKTKGGVYEYAKKEKGDGDDDDKKEKGDPISVDLNFDLEKHKAGVPKRSGSFKLILIDGETKKKGDIYDEDVVLEEAIRVGLVKEEKKGWSCLGETYSGKSLIEKRLLTDPLFSQTLRWAVLQVIIKTDEAWSEEEPIGTLPPETVEEVEKEVAT